MSDEGSRSPRWHIPLLVLLGLPIFFYGLGSYSVVNGDEGYYHSVAARMVESGDWFTLDFFGQHRVYDTFMNAPLQYWARAVLITLFGDNLWTMRLLSASFGLLTVLAVYRLGAELKPSSNGRTALFAALIQLTSFQFVYLHSARTGELDSVVAFLVTATALCFLRAVKNDKSFVPHHLCLAALLTVKLPVVALPVFAELLVFATSRSLRSQFKRYVLTGFAVVPIGLIWHMFQAGFLWDDFLDVADKMSAEASGAKGGGDFTGTPTENLRWYGEKLFFGAFPWSLAILPAIGATIAAAFSRARAAEALGFRLLLAFALVVWLFFAFVSKRFSWYILPSLPFLAVASGWWINSLTHTAKHVGAVLLAGVLTLMVWIRVPIASLRPLVDRTPSIAMESSWLELERFGTTTGILVTFALFAAGAFLFIHSRPKVGSAILANGLFVLMLGVAGVRVVYPLSDLEHVSQLDALYQRIESSRKSGERIRYPIALPESMGFLRIQHYFGSHYRVERRVGPRGAQILIVGEKVRADLEKE